MNAHILHGQSLATKFWSISFRSNHLSQVSSLSVLLDLATGRLSPVVVWTPCLFKETGQMGLKSHGFVLLCRGVGPGTGNDGFCWFTAVHSDVLRLVEQRNRKCQPLKHMVDGYGMMVWCSCWVFEAMVRRQAGSSADDSFGSQRMTNGSGSSALQRGQGDWRYGLCQAFGACASQLGAQQRHREKVFQCFRRRDCVSWTSKHFQASA